MIAAVLSVIFIYLVLASLYESTIVPFTIMISLPLCSRLKKESTKMRPMFSVLLPIFLKCVGAYVRKKSYAKGLAQWLDMTARST